MASTVVVALYNSLHRDSLRILRIPNYFHCTGVLYCLPHQDTHGVSLRHCDVFTFVESSEKQEQKYQMYEYWSHAVSTKSFNSGDDGALSTTGRWTSVSTSSTQCSPCDAENTAWIQEVLKRELDSKVMRLLNTDAFINCSDGHSGECTSQ